MHRCRWVCRASELAPQGAYLNIQSNPLPYGVVGAMRGPHLSVEAPDTRVHMEDWTPYGPHGSTEGMQRLSIIYYNVNIHKYLQNLRAASSIGRATDS